VDVYIGDAETEVRPVEGRSPRDEERLVQATLARLDERKQSAERERDDTKLCNSVRVGTGR
jgi:hypothetical protein